ncbi:winged helix-turn-helix domain-containing protein [Lentzea sp. HUAS12]|uniref:helix-turn-helix transcriptional regulator n=1 Tax=Lentzea sp. HUAS12 TaxID=2951806 RepID=UPI00209D39AF|nr:winged helix-turn-helix domain-containing protein [Lentzea sp. HUAS12]USX54402.1 winged helix-turn-helix domain-containing protein [Lentzea sp. HUAS12]
MRPAPPSRDHDTTAEDTSGSPDQAGPGTGARDPGRTAGAGWTFLSNHAHVLLCLAADPDQTLPVIAERVGITSRGVQLILTDLIEGGYVERTKVGRRNHYNINPDGHLRHPLEAHHSIADLITALGPAAHPHTTDESTAPRLRRHTG